jgi:release factor glutamine methyltransferase
MNYEFLIHINKNTMKIKEYRSQFIQELLSAYDGSKSFFYLILEEKHQLKRIDLALILSWFFSEGELFGILS